MVVRSKEASELGRPIDRDPSEKADEDEATRRFDASPDAGIDMVRADSRERKSQA
jgi:hypothetical protein